MFDETRYLTPQDIVIDYVINSQVIKIHIKYSYINNNLCLVVAVLVWLARSDNIP